MSTAAEWEDPIFSPAGLDRWERETMEWFLRWRAEHPEWSHVGEIERRRARYYGPAREEVWE